MDFDPAHGKFDFWRRVSLWESARNAEFNCPVGCACAVSTGHRKTKEGARGRGPEAVAAWAADALAAVKMLPRIP